MGIRSVKYELEAKLTPETGGLFSKPSGKLERKSYGDDTERLKVSFRNLKVPDASIGVVKADDIEILQIPISDGSGRYDFESSDGSGFPNLTVGQTIAVYVGNTLFLSGKLKED
jgi:hypothetical protein